jgi:hypothetical protein
MQEYLFCAENTYISVNVGGLDKTINKVLLHSETILVDEAVSQFFELFIIGVVSGWPLRQTVPPSHGHLFHQTFFRIFLFHFNSFYFLPRLSHLIAFLHSPLPLRLFLLLALWARL